MFPRLRVLSALLLSTVAVPVWAQQAVAKYVGTVGQQRVTVLLQLEGESLGGGSYSYDAQRSEIRIVDSRVFGTTLVLQDEDGNTLHLHFKDAGGGGAKDLSSAKRLDGTLTRGDLDLPVQLRLDLPR